MSATILTRDRTIRLLIDRRIDGLWMKGWIVQKDAQKAALLVSKGFAEYVLDGTPPPPDQLEWARALAGKEKADHAH